MPRASTLYICARCEFGAMVSAICTHIAEPSSAGVHDIGIGNVTAPSVGLRTAIDTFTTSPLRTVIAAGVADHCSTETGDVSGAGTVVSGAGGGIAAEGGVDTGTLGGATIGARSGGALSDGAWPGCVVSAPGSVADVVLGESAASVSVSVATC